MGDTHIESFSFSDNIQGRQSLVASFSFWTWSPLPLAFAGTINLTQSPRITPWKCPACRASQVGPVRAQCGGPRLARSSGHRASKTCLCSVPFDCPLRFPDVQCSIASGLDLPTQTKPSNKSSLQKFAIKKIARRFSTRLRAGHCEAENQPQPDPIKDYQNPISPCQLYPQILLNPPHVFHSPVKNLSSYLVNRRPCNPTHMIAIFANTHGPVALGLTFLPLMRKTRFQRSLHRRLGKPLRISSPFCPLFDVSTRSHNTHRHYLPLLIRLFVRPPHKPAPLRLSGADGGAPTGGSSLGKQLPASYSRGRVFFFLAMGGR